jgi:hypothetical protein
MTRVRAALAEWDPKGAAHDEPHPLVEAYLESAIAKGG